MTQIEEIDALVIGAGPAGLMAADMLAQAGRQVVVAEGKSSAGRKLLMAGKSGLNLTKDEPTDRFTAQYFEAADWLAPMLAAFGQEQVKDWAEEMGQPVFTGSSGRVFPKSMKASPLLRAWLNRINAEMRLKWHWRGFDDGAFQFATPNGMALLSPRVTVLALGGGSWARLGSDAAWVPWLADRNVQIAALKPANMGFCVDWSDHMEKHFGAPIKGCALSAGDHRVRAEFIISCNGVEGGGIYALSRQLRDGGQLKIDLLPGLSREEIAKRLTRPRGKASMATHLRKTLKLTGARMALLNECAHPLPKGDALAQLIKGLPLTLQGPRPIDEAISTAGGVAQDAMDEGLMLHDLPGVFCAGEMLDWEAPTGGYLVTACLATGAWAGRHAANWVQASDAR